MTDSFAFPTLPADLPPGWVVRAEEAEGQYKNREVIWVSEHPYPQAHTLWAQLYDQRLATGLYPLLLDTLTRHVGDDPDGRPWHSGELGYAPVRSIDALDPAEVLCAMWPEYDDDELPEPDVPRDWPGLAPPATGSEDPDTTAADLAGVLAGEKPRLIGLVPAATGADALTLSGWRGPLNHTNFTEEISAVVRSWQQRFGVRVVMVGFDTVYLSVAAPPTTHEHALQVAAEHLAFCPDNFAEQTMDAYARSLVDLATWTFWWD